ncbi:methyl-accepting chemotaxis protein [Halocella sp. SP3-1]|uniref:methyl-accepting chemotaxis protein n=1 Tax=Halocella sp. SP3-1 TaxID=2382161 RepID=UPI000F75B38B|nr:methyl-accepting chemotaxis protein [Halocella sp. SP3-1]AZO93853.1 methyl-accepting chemotaxis protein [Halocella sp. SP3-1]
MFKSIKIRMIAIISLVILILVAGSSFFAYNSSRNILEDTLDKTARDAANKNAIIFKEKLFDSINTISNLDITYIRDREDLMESLDGETLRSLYWMQVSDGFKELAEGKNSLETIFVVDTGGNYVDTLGESGNVLEEEYYDQAINSQEIVISTPIKQGGKDLIAILRPIIVRDKIRLLLGGTVSLDYLNQIASTMNINGYGYAWVIDEEMNTIVHANKGYWANQSIFKNEQQLKDIAEEMVAGKTGEEIYTVNGQEQKLTFAPVVETGWSLALTASNSELLSPLAVVKKGSITASLIAIILGIIISYLVSARIASPLIKLTEVTEKVAAGDLTQKINNVDTSRDDEIGRLAGSVRNMIGNLRIMIGKVAEISEGVATSSEKLTAAGDQVGESAEQVGVSIQNVAAGAEEQAAQIERTANNTNNLINKIDDINQGSNTMNEAAGHVMNDIKKGNESVNYSIKNINNVKTSTGEVAEIINTLGETSAEIDNIVGLINGIAAQTNLLALNAAIEAARAGNAGKGFSVVAEEIRQLAEESSGATEQIAVLISKIQKGVNNAIAEMDNNIEAVDNSVKAIDDTGDVFNEIEREALNLKELINEIVQNSQAMAEDSKQVEEAINDITELSEQFASNSEEVAASSEEQIAATEEIVDGAKDLNDMSEELTRSIDQFKLK